MDSSFVNSTPMNILEKVVAFTESRHQVLAGNIANLDTPGYQVRDLSLENFQEKLRAALEARELPASPGVVRLDAEVAMQEVDEAMKHITFHDGSNVGMEQQVAAITKNQFMHSLAVQILNSQYRMLETAISERV